MALLDTGDRFPDLVVSQVGGDKIDLPQSLHGRYGVVLFNRGSWCRYCVAQLRGFQRASADLEAVGASVVSLSADDEPTAREMVEQRSLTFPVGHSASPQELADLTGAFVHHDPDFVQATGFVLDPQGRVLVSAYSSGAIGRLVAEDVIGLINHVQSHTQKGS